MAAQAPVAGCGLHARMCYTHACMNCNEELVCNKCVSDTHKLHKTVRIQDIVSAKRKELQQYINKVSKTDNQGLQRDIAVTEDKIKENGKQFKKTIADIKDQVIKMKQEIDKCGDKLVQMCSELEKSNDNLLTTYMAALVKLRDENTRTIKDCQQVLKSGTDLEIIEKNKETRHESDSLSLPKIKTAEFKPGPILATRLEHSLGSVAVDGLDQQCIWVSKQIAESEFTFQKARFTTCRVSEDHAWLSHVLFKEIYRVSETGKVEETIRGKCKIGNITVSPTTGRLWFCGREDRTVREVMDSKKIEARVVTDSEPSSLIITDNNTVVVGMVGKIQMYTAEGQVIQSPGAGGPLKQGAVWPNSMAYNTLTGDVAVADIDGLAYTDIIAGKGLGHQPHVKVLDKHLNLQFRYPHQDASSLRTVADWNSRVMRQASFFPSDVCFDRTGNILISEALTKSIILIDGRQGEFIKIVHTDSLFPASVSLQTDGTLWVALMNTTIKILKNKL